MKICHVCGIECDDSQEVCLVCGADLTGSDYVARSNKGYYYVYNYGHYISGWNIKSGVWFKYVWDDAKENGEWKLGVNESSSINDLINEKKTQTMQDLALL